MSLLLLDTTVLIDAEPGAGTLDDVVADDDDTAIAAITVAELQVGALRANGARRAAGGRTVVTADPTGFEGLPDIEVRRHR